MLFVIDNKYLQKEIADWVFDLHHLVEFVSNIFMIRIFSHPRTFMREQSLCKGPTVYVCVYIYIYIQLLCKITTHI